MTESMERAPALTRGRQPIASVRHTVILVAILLAIAGYGAYLQSHAGSSPQLVEKHPSAIPLYLSLMAAQWGLVRYVTIGMKHGGTRLRDLLGQRWSSWKDVARDVVIALIVWGAWSLSAGAVERALGGDTAKGITTLLPRSPAEIAVWILLSMTAGFCEEMVFRGYLLRQFEALSGNALVGVLGQAVIFGVAHGYQGLRNVIAITVYGTVFGAVAVWRKSLKPGMILHAWTDIFGGIFAKG